MMASQMRVYLGSLVVVMVFWHCSLAERCHFPSSLQDDGAATWWLYQVTYSGAQFANNTIIYMEVFGSFMSTTSLAGNDVTDSYSPYEWECSQRYDDNTFLVKQFQVNHDVQYLCLQIVQRSEHVFQTRTSNSSENPLNCTNEPLQIDPWPYIKYTDRVETDSGCPFPGGFDLDLYDENGKYLCWDRYLTPRIECGCDASRMIQLDFQTCRVGHNRILMEIKQDLVNIADWVDGEYRFIIIKRADIALFWVLVLPADWSQSASGYLSADVVCSIDDLRSVSENLVRVNLTRRVIDSECRDFSPHCGISGDVCNETNPFDDFYCERTCNRCPPTTDDTISGRIQGHWTSLTHANSEFQISQRTIQIGNSSEAYVSSFDPMSATYKLVEFREGGCHPHYTCLTLSPISPSVMRYRISEGPVWSVFSKNSRCFERLEDNSVFKQRLFDIAVKTTGSFVSCEIPGHSYTLLATHTSTQPCRGFIDKPDCKGDEAKEFSIDLKQCQADTIPKLYKFGCLAHMEKTSEKHLVLAKDSITQSVFCLEYSHEMADISIYPATRCLYGFSQTRPIIALQVTEESAECGVHGINQSGSPLNLAKSVTQSAIGTMSAINNISEENVSNTSIQKDNSEKFNEMKEPVTDAPQKPKGSIGKDPKLRKNKTPKIDSWKRSNKTPKGPKPVDLSEEEGWRSESVTASDEGSQSETNVTTTRPRSVRHISASSANCFTYNCLILSLSLAHSLWLCSHHLE